jgi:hypothetical protein
LRFAFLPLQQSHNAAAAAAAAAATKRQQQHGRQQRRAQVSEHRNHLCFGLLASFMLSGCALFALESHLVLAIPAFESVTNTTTQRRRKPTTSKRQATSGYLQPICF